MTWKINKLNLVCGIVALLGIAQFFHAVLNAMNFFPGGYSITTNFLSDLGCADAIKNQNDMTSALNFNRSIILLGSLLIPFFTVMPAVLERRVEMLRYTGILSALGLIGIGLMPYDLYYFLHHVALGIWIVPLLVFVVSLAISIDLGRFSSAMLLFFSLLVVLAIGGYAFAGDPSGHVIFQKLVVILAACWFCLVFVIVSISTVQSIVSTRLIAEKQARQYLEVIQRNHRRSR